MEEPKMIFDLLIKEIDKIKPNLDLIKSLIKKDPSICNLKNNDGWTALMSASQHGNDKCVEVIVEYENKKRITMWKTMK